MARVLVAMSGGVDSSVAALLLKEQGFDCVGATMRLATPHTCNPSASRVCCSLDDIEDARAVARMLGIEHHAFDYTREFDERIVRPFVEEYLRGRTPSPCIRCNRYVKFDLLLRRALELGCDYIASGHYARILPSLPQDRPHVGARGESTGEGRMRLAQPRDLAKDQTYMLHSLTQKQLSRVVLPLGDLLKDEVRAIAKDAGLPIASKSESQDICFVPDGDYVGFIERYTGRTVEGGNILDRDGRVLGKHRGAVAYTLGQRKGIGVACGYPAYVCDKDMESNTVTVGPVEAIMAHECVVEGWNWVEEPPSEPLRVRAKTTYRHALEPATLVPLGADTVRLAFDEPVRAMCPGQAAVAYVDGFVVGGGTIRSQEDGLLG